MTEKLNVRILEVENGYVVFDEHTDLRTIPPKYVACSVFQLLEVVKGLCEKALKASS